MSGLLLHLRFPAVCLAQLVTQVHHQQTRDFRSRLDGWAGIVDREPMLNQPRVNVSCLLDIIKRPRYNKATLSHLVIGSNGHDVHYSN